MSQSPLELLIVEDVDSMRDLLRQTLDGIPGFRISGVARNGWEARIELTRRRPDLVILDEVLPGESSRDLCRELVKDGIDVIFITGISQPTHACPPEALGRIKKPDWKHLEADRKRLQAEITGLLTSSSRARNLPKGAAGGH